MEKTFDFDTSLNFNNSDEAYDSKIKHYVDNISNSYYIFEITKFCGYSEFITLFKDNSILELYSCVSRQMWCNNIRGLFTLTTQNTSQESDETEDMKLTEVFIKIPLSHNISIRDFIMKKKLRPIYSINKPCVYRIFLDDGHVHD